MCVYMHVYKHTFKEVQNSLRKKMPEREKIKQRETKANKKLKSAVVRERRIENILNGNAAILLEID